MQSMQKPGPVCVEGNTAFSAIRHQNKSNFLNLSANPFLNYHLLFLNYMMHSMLIVILCARTLICPSPSTTIIEQTCVQLDATVNGVHLAAIKPDLKPNRGHLLSM